jgi:hypothetical protein
MSPTAVRVTEAPAAGFLGSAAGLGPVAALARALAGLAEVAEPAADVLPGGAGGNDQRDGQTDKGQKPAAPHATQLSPAWACLRGR